MVIGWVLGLGDLHPFPRLLLMPGANDCWPYHDGPC
jgi:hypothetical protein